MNSNYSYKSKLKSKFDYWIFITLSFIIILEIGCKNCGEDISLGQVKLMNNSTFEFPYLNKEIAVFTNLTNDTIEYDIRGFKEVNKGRKTLNILCEHQSTNQDLFVEGESLGGILLFKGNPSLRNINEFNINLELTNLNTDNPTDSVLIDETKIYSTLYSENPTPGLQTPFSKISIITNDRSNQISNFIQNRAEVFNQELQLNGKTFTNAYLSNDTNKSIYYNLQYGIIGFEDENELWVLSHIE